MIARNMKEDARIRILVAKPGLDGHDVGAKIIVRALMEAGFEVMYTGLRKSPEEIVHTSADEQMDVLALSILSGSHIPLCRRIAELLHETDQKNILWIVGGNIPEKDHAELKEIGVDAVFPVGSSLQSIVDYVKTNVHES